MSLSKSKHLPEALELFKELDVATQVAKELCKRHNISYREKEGRKVRRWIQSQDFVKRQPKVLIYDIETTRMLAEVWWSGKQYIRANQIHGDPQIITVAWKWLGSNKIHHLTWKDKTDKQLIEEFLKVYNEADVIIGVNNDNFDNRFVNARAMKYGLDVNIHVRSFDIQKKAKRLFRLPSYSMAYLAEYLEIPGKYQHEGLPMWQKIQFSTSKREAKRALKEMVTYNVQDIATTEAIYLRLRPYFTPVTHLGVLMGKDKCSCPECGTSDVSLYKTTITPAGTVQRIMKCNKDNSKFRISNIQYSKL